jgi:aminoglycoside phosphotransferase
MTANAPSFDNVFLNAAHHTLGLKTEPRNMRSGAHSSVYKLRSGNKSWFLKIGDNLRPERERLEWLDGKLLVPQVLDFYDLHGRQAMLLTTVEGTDLATLCESMPAKVIVEHLANAVRTFHSVKADDCPFRAYTSGPTLVHGDACLPNFILNENQTIGYVDLGDMGVGHVDVDLSAAVWSLQRNVGAGYGSAFLRAYGSVETSEKEVDRLWQMYAHSPIFDR